MARPTPQAGRKWWGWGFDEGPSSTSKIQSDPSFYAVTPPSLDKLQIRPPRVALSELPKELREICYDDKFERVLHSRGRSFEDIVRNLNGDLPNPTDLVAFPKTEDQIQALLKYCSDNNIACVPFGGGSSVVGGVEPPEGDRYRGCITIDMKFFDKILEVDQSSLSARVQGGIYGPKLEAELGKLGLTLRHYPQSFEFSTLGGWIATRGGGHFATLWTHIDEFVQSVRLVTPKGVVQTRRLPASGAGPCQHRVYVGSEGMFGIITEAWVRVLRRPKYRASATLYFPAASSRASFLKGAECARLLSQSGLYPANSRLIEGPEALIAGVPIPADDKSPEPSSILILSFESADHNLDASLKRGLEICHQAGGVSIQEKWTTEGKKSDDATADKWGSSFKAAGYTRDLALCSGGIHETFETCVSWDQFPRFHEQVISAVEHVFKEEKLTTGTISCRFTHLYPDGPAPYYTIHAESSLEKRVAQWKAIKAAANRVIIEYGATATHHHAVGRMHSGVHEAERGEFFTNTLAAIKKVHDPQWILNPGVILRQPLSKL